MRDTVGFSNEDLAEELNGMRLGSPLLIATQSLILEALSMTLTVASISSNLPIRTPQSVARPAKNLTLTANADTHRLSLADLTTLRSSSDSSSSETAPRRKAAAPPRPCKVNELVDHGDGSGWYRKRKGAGEYETISNQRSPLPQSC